MSDEGALNPHLPISIGDQVLPLLNRLNRAQISLHSVFDHVINFKIKDSDHPLISFVTKNVGEGPYSILFDTLDFLKCDEDHENIFTRQMEKLKLTGHKEIKIWDSLLANKKIDSNKIRKNIDYLYSFLKEKNVEDSISFLINPRISKQPETVNEISKERFLNAINILALKDEKNLLRAIFKLKGLGIGLTPSGDDFICGFIWGNDFNESPIKKETREKIISISLGQNEIVNHFLNLAGKGFLTHKIFSFLKCIEENNFINNPNVLNWGETSGYDFATGFYFGITY